MKKAGTPANFAERMTAEEAREKLRTLRLANNDHIQIETENESGSAVSMTLRGTLLAQHIGTMMGPGAFTPVGLLWQHYMLRAIDAADCALGDVFVEHFGSNKSSLDIDDVGFVVGAVSRLAVERAVSAMRAHNAGEEDLAKMLASLQNAIQSGDLWAQKVASVEVHGREVGAVHLPGVRSLDESEAKKLTEEEVHMFLRQKNGPVS